MSEVRKRKKQAHLRMDQEEHVQLSYLKALWGVERDAEVLRRCLEIVFMQRKYDQPDVLETARDLVATEWGDS